MTDIIGIADDFGTGKLRHREIAAPRRPTPPTHDDASARVRATRMMGEAGALRSHGFASIPVDAPMRRSSSSPSLADIAP
ncbi:hypothetical protein [Burkholderia pseudomallei]|uniref:hypothetical protein n=1 Tax=Burkholderia pseudomallei TaxID=28450 RepID=UPI00031BDD37|nr:hypothetical protein [Burkholderia pseudomallei]